MLRLPPYRYHRPSTIDQAISLIGEHDGEAMFVAGGTDLVPNMKHRLFEPSHLIALKGIDELLGVRQENGHLRIGAAETLTSVATNHEVRSLFPALADAAAHVAGPQLRNAGTIGGDVCLDTRCTYYNQNEEWRESIGYCMKEVGSTCWVAPGSPRCWAVNSSDSVPVLIALEARAHLEGPEGERDVAVADLFRDDGIDYLAKAKDEVLVALEIPPQDGAVSVYRKVRRRGAFDWE